MTATEAGITALVLGDAETGAWALDVLDPWTELCSFDSEGLWPALPVSLVTRDLRALAGDLEGTRRDHANAREVAGRLRSRPALEALRGTLASRGPLVSGRPDGIELTARQVAVLQRVASGLTNEQIASELHLSRATVVREVGAVYRTLGAANRAEAVRRASAVGLLLD
jgi:DNA-binding CsgD family transcriptional regulator